VFIFKITKYIKLSISELSLLRQNYTFFTGKIPGNFPGNTGILITGKFWGKLFNPGNLPEFSCGS